MYYAFMYKFTETLRQYISIYICNVYKLSIQSNLWLTWHLYCHEIYTIEQQIQSMEIMLVFLTDYNCLIYKRYFALYPSVRVIWITFSYDQFKIE